MIAVPLILSIEETPFKKSNTFGTCGRTLIVKN